MSFVAESNTGVTSGYSVTVSGLNFGVAATTPTSTIGLSSCATAAWASTSSVVCMLSMGEGVGHELRMTVAGVVGSRTTTFSYDGKDSAKQLFARLAGPVAARQGGNCFCRHRPWLLPTSSHIPSWRTPI